MLICLIPNYAKKEEENMYCNTHTHTQTQKTLSFLPHFDSQQLGEIDGGNWIQLVGGRQPQLQANENNTT